MSFKRHYFFLPLSVLKWVKTLLTLFNPPPVELKKKQEKQDKTAANPHKISARACPVLLRLKTGQTGQTGQKQEQRVLKTAKKGVFFFFDGLEPEKN